MNACSESTELSAQGLESGISPGPGRAQCTKRQKCPILDRPWIFVVEGPLPLDDHLQRVSIKLDTDGPYFSYNHLWMLCDYLKEIAKNISVEDILQAMA